LPSDSNPPNTVSKALAICLIAGGATTKIESSNRTRENN
jgi:hypothetical protein